MATCLALPAGNEASSPAWLLARDRILTVGADGTARVWDLPSGQPPLVLDPGGGPVEVALWTPDGSSPAVERQHDGVVASGRCMRLRGHHQAEKGEEHPGDESSRADSHLSLIHISEPTRH